MPDPLVEKLYNPRNVVPEIAIPVDVDSPIDQSAWAKYRESLLANGYRPLTEEGDPSSTGDDFSVGSFTITFVDDQSGGRYHKRYDLVPKPVMFRGDGLVVDLVEAGIVSESRMASGEYPNLMALAASNRYLRGSQEAVAALNDIPGVTYNDFESFVRRNRI